MNIRPTLLIGGLLIAQAIFLAATFETLLVVSMTVVLATMVVLAQSRWVHSDGDTPARRVPRWARWLALILLFAVVIGISAGWRLGSHLGQNINPIFVGGDMLAHATLFSSLAVWTIRPKAGHLSLLPLGLILILVCVAAGGASRSLAAQTTVGMAACLGYAVASQLILGAARRARGSHLLLGRSVDSSTPHATSIWLGPMFSMLTVSLLLMATSAIANVTEKILPGIQDRLKQQLQASFDAVGDEVYVGGTRYVDGSRLGSVRHHLLGDPREVALRIHADVAPGYLRGNVFDVYRARRWFSASTLGSDRPDEIPSMQSRAIASAGDGNVTLKRPTTKPLKRFQLTESTGARTVTLEIHNDPMKGSVIFLPLKTHWIEAKSRELVVNHHGVVLLGIDVNSPYVAGIGAALPREEMPPQRREMLLDVPSSAKEQVAQVADLVCQGSSSAPAKAAAISQYFQRGFSYSLNTTKPPVGVDPITYFLQTHHAAHCEYFASATVLLLRAAGVPSRYVTGYVANQLDPETETIWLAHNRDAHAWAEAYDDRTGEWFAVESTPGRAYQTVDPLAQQQSSQGFFFNVFGESNQEDAEGLFSRLSGWILSMRATDPLLLLLRAAQLPLFCVLAFLLWSKYFRTTGGALDPIDQRSRKMLRQVDRRLRKSSLVRHPSETLYQFADRIERHARDQSASLSDRDRSRCDDVALWYRQFANARYQGELPMPYSGSQQRVAMS